MDGEVRAIYEWLEQGRELAQALEVARGDFEETFDEGNNDPDQEASDTAKIDQIRATWSDWARQAPLTVSIAFADAQRQP